MNLPKKFLDMVALAGMDQDERAEVKRLEAVVEANEPTYFKLGERQGYNEDSFNAHIRLALLYAGNTATGKSREHVQSAAQLLGTHENPFNSAERMLLNVIAESVGYDRTELDITIAGAIPFTGKPNYRSDIASILKSPPEKQIIDTGALKDYGSNDKNDLLGRNFELIIDKPIETTKLKSEKWKI